MRVKLFGSFVPRPQERGEDASEYGEYKRHVAYKRMLKDGEQEA